MVKCSKKMSAPDKKDTAKKSDKKVKHVGFEGAQKAVEKEGYDKKTAAKIVAASTRNASAAAKKANPKLKKVKG